MRTTRRATGCLLRRSAAAVGSSSDATAADEVLGRAAQAWALAGGDIDTLLGRAIQPPPAVDVADGRPCKILPATLSSTL